MKIASRVTYIFIIIFLILFNLSSIFNVQIFGFRTFKIGSGSMEPTLKVNDLILVRKQKTYKDNDIVTFKSSNEYITHRIVEQNKTKVVTKGDANNALDQEFCKDKIIGKVVYKFKVLNIVGKIFNNIYTFIIFSIVSFTIFYLLFIYRKK